jgi:acetyltransferase
MHTDPSALFEFNSVAIVGATEEPGRIGGSPIYLLKKYGFDGRVIGVNPKYTTVQGVPCVPSVEDIAEQVDLAIFCVSAEAVRRALPVLAGKGLKAAVIFSAGFGETAGRGQELQRWLSEFVRSHGIALVGPNCVGQISFARKRPITFANSVVGYPAQPAGRVALLSQSGGVATNIWADAVLAGARFSHMITTGNEAGLGLTDFLSYLAQDEATDAVLGYVEGLRDGEAFCAGAAAMQRAGKPLVLMRVGVSEAGQDAVASHTGQMSSDDAGYQAAFDRYGVIRARTLGELNDYARIFSLRDPQPKITTVTTSGGAGVYVADLCAELGIEFSTLSPETEKQLSEIVPSYGRIRNPVDLTAQVVNDMSILLRSMRILLDDPQTGILIFLLSGKGDEKNSAEVIELFLKLQAETTKTLVICWLGVSETVRLRAAAAGLIVYQDPARFLIPLKQRLDQAAAPRSQADDSPPAAPPPVALGAMMLNGADGRAILTERASLDLLERFGADCPKRWFAASDDDIAKLAAEVSYPCVMKVTQPVIAHKSDVGGVVVGIGSAEALQQTWQSMRAGIGATEVMVVEQIEKGVEVLVGCIRDEVFGLRVTIGSGGIWTNYIRDAVTLIPPFTEAEVRRVLPRLGVWAPLSGARGQPPLAVDALVRTILAIARFGHATRGDLREFECNPVIVTRHRAVIVDAIGFA